MSSLNYGLDFSLFPVLKNFRSNGTLFGTISSSPIAIRIPFDKMNL